MSHPSTAPHVEAHRARVSRVERARTLALRLLVATALWWILNEGRAISLAFSAVVIALAVLVGLRVSDVRPARWRPRGLVELAGVFLVGSFRGAIDVARLAFARSVPVDPAMVDYRLGLPASPGGHIFTGALSMAPGSLAVTERGPDIGIHVLVQSDAMQKLAARLERSISHAVSHAADHAVGKEATHA